MGGRVINCALVFFFLYLERKIGFSLKVVGIVKELKRVLAWIWNECYSNWIFFLVDFLSILNKIKGVVIKDKRNI